MRLHQALRAPTGMTFSYVGKTSSINSATVTTPADTQTGDILLLMDISLNASSFVTPSGFTTLATEPWTYRYSVGKATQSGSYSITGTADAGLGVYKYLYVIRPSRSVASFSGSGWVTYGTGVGASSRTFDASAVNTPGIVWMKRGLTAFASQTAAPTADYIYDEIDGYAEVMWFVETAADKGLKTLSGGTDEGYDYGYIQCNL